MICEICDTVDSVKIYRRYVKDAAGKLVSLDRQLCKDCMLFTESYLKIFSEYIPNE